MRRRPPRSTLFPYTTLFRSKRCVVSSTITSTNVSRNTPAKPCGWPPDRPEKLTTPGCRRDAAPRAIRRAGHPARRAPAAEARPGFRVVLGENPGRARARCSRRHPPPSRVRRSRPRVREAEIRLPGGGSRLGLRDPVEGRRSAAAGSGQPRIRRRARAQVALRSEEHTSELQSRQYLVCRLLLEKK